MAKSTLDWKNDGRDIDTDNLSKPLAAKWNAYKASSAQTTKLRKDFEVDIIAAAREAKMITADQTLAFGYKFGKCRMVATGADAPKAKTTSGVKF